MKSYEIYDEFYKKLPEITFSDALSKPLHKEKLSGWNLRKKQDGEVLVSILNVDTSFPDPEGLLGSAWCDFRDFMESASIAAGEGGHTLTAILGKTECFEAYTVTVTEDSITILSADTEGVRRALIYIEDEMCRRSGSFLPLGSVNRKPFIKNRISRCYFTPASHAGNEEVENELCDDKDYYPDAYLQRLAHDGVNALWLGASLRYLVKSKLVPEYGTDAEKRMKKLNGVIDKCRRFGIKVFLFAVDPASSYNNPHLLAHPEMIDDSRGKWRVICPSTDAAVDYLTDAVTTLFRNAPHLAGYINLTCGESLSTCASVYGGELQCKRCKKKFGSLGKTLAFVEKTIADAIHSVSPNAEYISWTYEQRNWRREYLEDSCLTRDAGVVHLQNFEDLGRPVQLGKKRIAYDYWLSYVGPGKLFEDTLQLNKKRGTRTYAKIQVCSSHEISTVPYVIAPGILYDKYKYFYENGIDGVMQCWFFGNYPCLMNKAACELSFLPFPESKDSFLKSLAGIYWGKDSDTVASAWSLFEDGYKSFPVSVSFEWLGPMQDSPVAPLHLLPIDRSMPSTWLATDAVGGDRLGECMLNAHTHEDVVELVGHMVRSWCDGLRILEKIPSSDSEIRREQMSVARATSLIFRSGYNVIRFYYLRRLLGIGEGDAKKILSEMRKIAEMEIEISQKLIPICKSDNRIGYHSEAHGHKIFPEKLEWRIGKLIELLESEFPEVEARIKLGKAPLLFYTGAESDVVYQIGEDGWLPLVRKDGKESDTRIRINECDGGYELILEVKDFMDDFIVIKPEYRIFHPSAPMMITKNEFLFSTSNRSFFAFANSYRSFGIAPDEVNSEIEKYSFKSEKLYDESYIFKLFIERERFGMTRTEPFRLDIERFSPGASYDKGCTNAKEALFFSDKTVTRLVHGTFSPECYAFILPKQK